MNDTPSPTIRPPASNGRSPSPPNPTMSRPTLTTTTAITMLKIVTGTLYPMAWPGMVNPSTALHLPGARGAPQTQETAQAGHGIGERGRQQPVREIVHGHHRRAPRP